MDALNRTHRVVVMANDHECRVWKEFAETRGYRLSPFVRLMLNNATGVNDPPELEPFTDDDLASYRRMVSEGDLRRLLGESRDARIPVVFSALAFLFVALSLALQLGGAIGLWHL